MRTSTLTTTALALLQAGYLFAWTTPERVDRRPDGYNTFMPALAVTPDGKVHAVWSETPEAQYEDKVVYARKDGDTWTIPVNISRDSGDLRTQVIASDTLGHLVVVWSEEGSARIRYVRQLGDTWSEPKLCFPHHGITPRIVADSRGRIHLVFEDLSSQGGIWYSYYVAEADTWATPTRVALGTAELGWSSLAVDRFDHLHAVWGDWGTYGVDYAAYDGAQWSPPEPLPDPAPTGQSCDPCVAADATGKPHVVWQERSGGYLIHYSEKVGDTWTTPYRVHDQNGSLPVVDIDTLGNVHVVWGWGDGLRHAERTSTGWQESEIITDSAAFYKQVVRARSRLHLIWSESHAFHGYIYYSEQDVSGGCVESGGRRGAVEPAVTMGRTPMLTYTLSESAPVSVTLTDAAGKLVSRYSLGWQSPGPHRLLLRPLGLCLGVYFTHLSISSNRYTLKAVVVR